MERLGLERHKTEGTFGQGSTVAEHFRFVRDSVAMKFSVTEAKQKKVRTHASSLLNEVARSRGWVCRGSLRAFTSFHFAPSSSTACPILHALAP